MPLPWSFIHTLLALTLLKLPLEFRHPLVKQLKSINRHIRLMTGYRGQRFSVYAATVKHYLWKQYGAEPGDMSQWLCKDKYACIFKYSLCCTDVHPEMLEAVQTTSAWNLLCIFLTFHSFRVYDAFCCAVLLQTCVFIRTILMDMRVCSVAIKERKKAIETDLDYWNIQTVCDFVVCCSNSQLTLH